MALRHQLSRMEVGRPGRGESPDWVAVEEPLEVRIAGESVATLMRTPGDDHLLALGFLHAERVLEGAEDVASIVHCGVPGEEGYGNVVDVRPAGGARIAWERVGGGRQGAVSSACGVCGRSTVDDLLEGLQPLPPGPVLEVGAIRAAMEALRGHQPAFDATGGTHAAAAWAAEGVLLAVHEDVGRHNAVDKVVGALLVRRAAEGDTGPRPELLTVSGRAGVEIIQKAVRAGIPIVASVSAPTSLAVQLAREAGLTLLGFVRGEKMNVYSGSARLAGGTDAVAAA